MTDIFIYLILTVLVIWASVFIGFWMGWKGKRPGDKLIERKFNPGPTDTDDEDIFRDALKPDEDERGIPTL